MEALDILFNPNLAYILLVLGIVLGLLAIVTPGSGILEIGALFCLVLPVYVAYRQGLNWWALFVLAGSLVPFLYAIRKPKREWALGLTILILILGSIYLYPDLEGRWWVPGVNPLLALIVSATAAAFLWFVILKAVKAMQARPSHDLGALIGQVGEAKTRIHEEGSAQVAGELWSARSAKPIAAGSAVRVVNREGFVLTVESDKPSA
ncbi:MAG: hypothetical protein JXB85_02695 [Anaerolineales bacterium]|nr:hypothetical protein [Anaerolineales bacterium]